MRTLRMGKLKKKHNILRREWIGLWELTLGVSPTGRFIVHLRFPGEPSWTRTKFFSSHAQADTTYFEWRDTRARKAMAAALLGEQDLER